MTGLVEIPIRDLPRECLRDQSASKVSGVVRFREEDRQHLGRIGIHFHGNDPQTVKGIDLTFHSIPSVQFCVSDSHQTLHFGEGCTGPWIFRMWGKSSAVIGSGTSTNGSEVFLNWGGRLSIGKDCMFSDKTLFLVGDNHAIFDVKTLAPINVRAHPVIELGDHVWVSHGSKILANTKIGAGSVVAAGSIAKGTFSMCSLVAGVPGKTIKTGISWTRNHLGHQADEVVVSHRLSGRDSRTWQFLSRLVGWPAALRW